MPNVMRKCVLPAMIGVTLLASAAMASSSKVTTVAVFGDAPYGTTPTDTAEFNATPAFIDSINADRDVSLVLHVGDIHSGKQFCTEAYDRSIYEKWQNFQDPIVYTPGDNEWADCHKTGEGGGLYNSATLQIDYKLDATGNPIDFASGDPVANLGLVRSIFFANPGYAIGGSKEVHSQAQEFDVVHPNDANFVENVWWVEKVGTSKVLFVTLNVPGGSNNDSDIWYGAPTMSAAQAQEVADRTAADLRWLDTAFKHAGAGTVGVVIGLQADMWDLDGKSPSHIANYKQFIDSIAAHAISFGGPVLLINGDSHTYRSDNPLVAAAPCVIESSPTTVVACGNDAYANQPNGYNVANFHRIVVHGSTFPLEWLKLSIDAGAHADNGAKAFGPFNWQRVNN